MFHSFLREHPFQNFGQVIYKDIQSVGAVNTLIGAELADAMSMCGAKTLKDITPDMVFVK